MGMDPTIDHAGPLTATVADNALLDFGPSGSPDKSAHEIATRPFSPAENLEELSEAGVRVERPILDLTKVVNEAARELTGRRPY